MVLSEVKPLKALEDENARLKRLLTQNPRNNTLDTLWCKMQTLEQACRPDPIRIEGLPLAPKSVFNRGMGTTRRIRCLGVLLTLFIALCTAMLGFAHRAPSAGDEALRVYVLSGQSLADLCATDPGMIDAHCPACHLVGGAVVPPPCDLTRHVKFHVIARVDAPVEIPVRQVRDPGLGLRAPPRV